MSNHLLQHSPLSPSVYLSNGSHSSTTTFSDHTAGGWQWPKWSCELDAFCDSAKRVIRDLGSVLQPEHLAQFELEYFLRRSSSDAGIGGVVDSDNNTSSGGYLSDVSSLDHNHGPAAQLLFINNEVESSSSYLPRRASPRFSVHTDSTVSLEAAAYFTDSEGEEEESPEGRGRPWDRDMAGTMLAASSKEKKKSKSDKKDKEREREKEKEKSVRKHEDSEHEDREQRREARRKRRAEREERKAREAQEEAERAERKREKQERRERKEEKKSVVGTKEKTMPKISVEQFISGIGFVYHFFDHLFTVRWFFMEAVI